MSKEKHAKLGKYFGEKYDVFQHSSDDISAICWSILMQNSVLERLLVANYMTEIRM
jgi:hypothetical protein